MSGWGKTGVPSFPVGSIVPLIVPPPAPPLPSVAQALIDEAKKYLGVKEQGNNGGSQVNAFQACVGLSTGDSWCMAFQIFLVKAVAKSRGITPKIVTNSGHCLTVYSKSPKSQRCAAEPGAIVIWEHGSSSSGHTGLVVSVGTDGTLTTIEGNTGPEDHVNANGDGVYLKHRDPKGTGDMHVVGFLRPF